MFTWSMYPAIQVSLQTECEVFCRIVIKSPFPPAGVDHRSGADETLEEVVLRHRVDRGEVAATLHKVDKLKNRTLNIFAFLHKLVKLKNRTLNIFSLLHKLNKLKTGL